MLKIVVIGFIIVCALSYAFGWRRWLERPYQVRAYDREHPADEGIELGSYYHA